jgi:putative transposase
METSPSRAHVRTTSRMSSSAQHGPVEASQAARSWPACFPDLPAAGLRARIGRCADGRGPGREEQHCHLEGVMGHAPGLSVGEQGRFLVLSRRLNRQQKGSNRRNQTRLSLAALPARLGNRRIHMAQVTANWLVREYDLISFEDLATANMVRRPKPRPDPERPGVFLPNGANAKAGLNRAILGSCWGQIADMVDYKAKSTPEDSRTVVVRFNPHNTSRRCHTCGHIAAGSRASQAVFQCVPCGQQGHADTNAARNILRLGEVRHLQEEVCGRSERQRTRQPRAKTRAASTPKAA